MEKRADNLRIKIDNEKFIEELIDDKKFMTHLTMCSLLNINHDDKFIDNFFKELNVKSCISTIAKIKLINEVQSILNISPLCITNQLNDIDIHEDKQNIIKKVFGTKYVNIIKMYRNLIPSLISSSTIKINGEKVTSYSIDRDIIKHHIKLLQVRNVDLTNINKETLKHCNHVEPSPKKLF